MSWHFTLKTCHYKRAQRGIAVRPEASIHRLGAEHPLEPRADKLNADDFFALGQRLADVHNFALRFKILFAPARGVALNRDSNLQVRANGDIKPRAKCGSAAA